MRCSDARRKLSALLDDAGDPPVRDAVARHVDGCGACRAELAALALVDRSLGEALGGDAPPEILEGFWSRLQPKLVAVDGQEAKPELDDLRALAASALRKAAEQSAPAEAAAAAELYHAPAALGQVVLPVPDASPRRKRWPVALGGAVTLAALLVIALVVVRGESPAPSAPAAESATPPPPSPSPSPAPSPSPSPTPPPPPPPAPASAPPSTATGGAAPAREDRAKRLSTREAPRAPAPPGEPKVVGRAASLPSPSPSAGEILDELSSPPPPPPAAAASPPEREKLSHDEIKAGMSPVAGEVQRCYDEHKVAGVVFLKVKIEPDGKVASAEPTGTFAGSETGACVARAVMRARFAPFGGPPLSIRYSFKLEDIE